ncbi:MAG TPA: D-alanyl-D-alanine carboxypeptidase [Glaciihabitans sp.]|nr:D-alanyl-D-alanine carboxypeptidase [Glaciihabitans sp.]
MPITRQQMYRRRRITIFSAAAVVLAGGIYVPSALLAPVDAVSAEVPALTVAAAATAELTLPSYGASGIAAVGMPGLLASSGATEPLPIASISKVITTLVVLDAKPIGVDEDGENIAFTSDDVQIYNDYVAVNGSVKPVSAGSTLTEREVIELMLVGSANNYAQSLVNWAFGSEREYAVAAAEWLTRNGLTATTVADATGMSPNNVSTPTDLVALGSLALANPLVAEIIAMQDITVPDVGQLSNTNKLLGIDGIDGIKTGTLDEAGACLLFSADILVGSETVTLVGVVLGGDDHSTVNTTVRAMLQSVSAGFHEQSLITEGQQLGSYSTAWGDSAEVIAAETSSIVVWSDTPISADVETEPVSTGAAGDVVGTVTFNVGNNTVVVPLELANAIDDPSSLWRLTNPGELF